MYLLPRTSMHWECRGCRRTNLGNRGSVMDPIRPMRRPLGQEVGKTGTLGLIVLPMSYH